MAASAKGKPMDFDWYSTDDKTIPLFAAMGENMTEKRRKKSDVIMDCYTIKLEKDFDDNKLPEAVVFRTNEDGDMTCVVVLKVPSLNDYGAKNNNILEEMEI